MLVRSVNSKINNNASVASACVSASVQHIVCVVFFVILLQLFVKCYANYCLHNVSTFLCCCCCVVCKCVFVLHVVRFAVVAVVLVIAYCCFVCKCFF